MADGARAWWDAHKPTRRRLAQLYAAALYNAHAKGFIQGRIYTGGAKALCVPGLHCYSCPGAVGACPLGALQNALASSGVRAPFYVLGVLLLYGLTLGRTVCGWLCPFGLVQELIHKLPVPKLKKSRVTRALSCLKYVLLALLAVALPLALGFPAFCKYVCPAGTLEGGIGLLAHPANADKRAMLGGLFAGKFAVMAAVFAACAFVYRPFCRFLCPLGAIYGLFARISVVGVRVDAHKCTGCGRCAARCRMDVRRVGDSECIHCGACIDGCPTGAISLRAGRHALWTPGEKRGGRARRALLCGAALALLAVALVGFNAPEQEKPAGTALSAMPLCNGEGSFSLADARGRPVVLNFWATWCAPCVEELPRFQRLYETYGDRVAVVAVHSSLVTEDVRAWLEGTGYTMPFALDETGGVLGALSDPTMLPVTVVLDASGEVVYNRAGSISYEQLEGLIEPLL